MRRLLALALLAAVIVSGCGSSSSKSTSGSGGSSGSAGGVIGSELSYVPAGSPVVFTVATDPNSSQITSTEALLRRFPLFSAVESLITSKINGLGVNYNTQVKPLLGNPLVVAANSALPSGATANDIIVVWRTASAAALQSLIKHVPNDHSVGTADGATLYSSGGSAVIAIDGASLVLANSAAQVKSALSLHANGGGFSTNEYTSLTSGLPSTALVQLFGNLSGELSTAKAAQARTIPWVGAIEGYGVSLGVQSSGLGISFRLDTSGKPLTAGQLPLATSTTAPTFAGSPPIALGVSDPGQAITFVINAIKQADPSEYQKASGNELNALNALGGQLTGNLSVSSDTKTTLARATLSDPSKANSELLALIHATKGTPPKALGGGFYAGPATNGAPTIYGIVGSQFVIGRATVAQLKQFAAEPSTPAQNAHGGLAFKIQLLPLLRLSGNPELSSPIVGTILQQLGDVTGTVSDTPSALTGTATLAVK